MIYEDKPNYGLILKLIVVVVPGSLLIGSVLASLAGDYDVAIPMLADALVISLIFWLIFPRNYQIFNDHVKIVLGGPFSVRVKFEKIKSVGTSGGLSLGVNFVTTITRSYVAIVRTNGISVNITPGNSRLFIENLNRALDSWRSLRKPAIPASSQSARRRP